MIRTDGYFLNNKYIIFFLFLHLLLLEGCEGSSSKLSHHIFRLTNTNCISLKVPNGSHHNPQYNQAILFVVIFHSLQHKKFALKYPLLKYSAYMAKSSKLKCFVLQGLSNIAVVIFILLLLTVFSGL